ncbi:D-alanyl-D-alanine carboxypeptidase [Streptomyces fuscichromogenes]|uniref:serine-type D-Ala-D-Ala carboxypeptidase n=1 Tax=Streptomyces fuscichromogenes TaxID=1324013 RepID=A0A917XE30_9ACTN|nr:D-alanyl-D-alanine carboxypeptidase [Streptomyces fuscichromogenes]
MVRTAHGNVRSVEEASVAGESPDRSKQRESSEEPTSGNAGAVPEARDPRLAVAAEKETAGGVDTATRIFSVRDRKASADGAGKDDAKLREAVAAWVRTGDPTQDTAQDAEDPTEDPAEDSAADGTQEPPEAAREPEDGPEAPEEHQDTPEPPENPTETAEPQGTESTTTTDPRGTAPEDNPTAATEPKPTPDPQDATPQDESATTADPEDAKPEERPTATAEPEDKPTAAAEPQDAAPKADAEPQDAAPQGESATTAEPEDAKPEDRSATTTEPEDAKPQGESATTAEPEDAKPGSRGADGSAAAAGDAPKAEDAPADADGGDGPQGPPAADDDGRTGGAGGKTGGAEGEAEAGRGAEGGTAPAVDQPTAMLKAPRPPQVDQPTTMLKLGGATKPEGDAERTSRFVALKSDIGPDTGKAPKPEAASTTRTTVLPQIGPERTTQQPLPPKPPLDLLAELTNTPPPPETPVRTLFRRVKIWTPLVIVALIVFAVAQTLRPLPQPTLDLTAKDTYTFDGSKADIPWPADGQAALDVQGIGTFGSSGEQKPVPIASVAKVMTAYIVLRDHPLKSGAAGPKIKIDQAAQDQANAGQESTVDVTAGDSITQREALESILIASANNVARLLARWDAGSEKAFVAKMNATAKKLGMTDTTYTDPSGLTNSTVSTAVDQVKLAKAAMASEPSFREVAAMMSYDDYKGVNHGNWNQLVGHNDVVGIKTGTTTSALGNLVFAAKKTVGGETRTIIGAVLRQPASAASDNSILTAALNGGDKLIRAAQGALESATIYKKGDVVGYVDDGLGGRTPVVATEDVTAVGWAGLKVRLSFQADDVPHTAKAGTKVGTLTVGDGSGSAVQVPVALEKELTEPGFAAKLTRLG